MGGFKHRRSSAAALATPYTELSLALSPASGTPSSILHDATLDAGLFSGWKVYDPAGRIVSISDDGSKLTVVVSPGTYDDDTWGHGNGPQFNSGAVALYYPTRVAGSLDAEVDVDWTMNGGGNSSCGVIQYADAGNSEANSCYMFSGLYSASTTLQKARLQIKSFSNAGALAESGTFAHALRHKTRLVVTDAGLVRGYYTKNGFAEVEHGSPSGLPQVTPGGPAWLGIGFFAKDAGKNETYDIYSFTATANAAAGSTLGAQLIADLDMTALGSADWSGGDADHTVANVTVSATNTAGASTFGPDGSTGVNMVPNSGVDDDGSVRDAPRLEVDLSGIVQGSWPFPRIWATVEFTVAFASNAANHIDIGVCHDDGTTRVFARLDGSGNVMGGRSNSSGGATQGSTALAAVWMGLIPHAGMASAFGNTGAVPSDPASGDFVTTTNAWGPAASDIASWFNAAEANTTIYVACGSPSGSVPTQVLVKRIRIWEVVP